MEKKIDYILFCECCSHPLKVPGYIIQSYFIDNGVRGAYCPNCYKKNQIPKKMKWMWKYYG